MAINCCIAMRIINNDKWTDVLRFYVLFNSISVISGQRTDDYETLVRNGIPFTVEKIFPRAGLESETASA